uniref:SKP1 component POZ domain-containing protein n=1 Tax=Lotharella oceanica TaxID=641309 RepID=A0A7S2TUB1_9EUKA
MTEEAAGLDVDEVTEKPVKEREITLKSGDGKTFKLSSKEAIISKMIKAALQDPDANEVELKKIKGITLQKVVQYMKMRKGIDMEELKWPIKHKTMVEILGKGNEDIAKWVDEVAKHRANFYDLLLATVRLDIKGLQCAGVAKIASLLKYCKAEDLDRVLDPAIQDGKLLPLRQSVIEERKKEEEERIRKREERKKAREKKEAEAKAAEATKAKDKTEGSK